jgi:hypothetical protein
MGLAVLHRGSSGQSSTTTPGTPAIKPPFCLSQHRRVPVPLHSKGRDINGVSLSIFLRAPLRCARAYGVRKNFVVGFDGTSETRALTLVSWTEAREEYVKGWGPGLSEPCSY